MARQIVNIGTTANDGTGDTLRIAGQKLNSNFAELYLALGGDSDQLSSGVTLTDQGVKFEGTNIDQWETTLVASNPSSDITLALPAVGTQVISNTATQTMSNKTLTSPILTTPQFNDTSADHQYIVSVSELAADRTINLPLLTGNDTFAFVDHTQTLTNKTLTAPTLNTPKVGTSINDVNGAELIEVTATASAVNQIIIGNAATGNGPTISSKGFDADIDLKLGSKGSGQIAHENGVRFKAEKIVASAQAMSLTVPTTHFAGTSNLTGITLADGNSGDLGAGEIKYFFNSGSGTVVITPTSLAGASSVTVAQNEAGFFIWSGSNWHLASKTVAS